MLDKKAQHSTDVIAHPISTHEVKCYGAADNEDLSSLKPNGKDTDEWNSSPLAWVVGLEKAIGLNLLLAIVAGDHLLKGFNHSVFAHSRSYLFREHHVPAATMSIFLSISKLPWPLKPLWGLISDLFPVLGYRKLPYMFLASTLGITSAIIIGTDFHYQLDVRFVLVLLMCFSLQTAVCDLLTEAQYSEKVQEHPRRGPDLVSFVWGGQVAMRFVKDALLGPVLHTSGPSVVFLICLVPATFIMVPLWLNWLGERKVSYEEAIAKRAKLMTDWEALLPVFALVSASITMLVAGLTIHSVTVTSFISLGCFLWVLGIINLTIRPEIGKILTWYMISQALEARFESATFYFYVDGPDEFPAGPHFTPMFQASVMGFVSDCFALVGLFVYVRFAKKWRYHSILRISMAVSCSVQCLDIVFFLRLNKALGIPDTIFALGWTAVYEAIHYIRYMPHMLMLSQLCPKGLEGTMFAILAGAGNFSYAIQEIFGAFLLNLYGVNPHGKPGDGPLLENLWKVVLFSAFLPLIMILLIPKMIPDASQTEPLLVDEPSSATWGSPLRRILGRPTPGTPAATDSA